MFTLKKTIARNVPTDHDDVAAIKLGLTSLGYYDDSKTGLSSYSDDDLFTSIRLFQKDNNLEIDGIIKADGPTQTKIKEKLLEDTKASTAFGDFWRNYWDMREADTIGADKYFHCKANFDATKRGWDGDIIAQFTSNFREVFDIATDSLKNGLYNTLEDTKQDSRANLHGRNAARSGKYQLSKDACAIYRPKGLNEKY